MNALPLLAASVVLAIGSGVATHLALRPAKPAEGPVLPGEAGAGAGRELQALAAAVSALEERVAELAARPSSASDERRPALDLDAAIESYLARHHPGLVAGTGVTVGAAPVVIASAKDLLARLLDPELDWDAREAIFTEAREAGEIDALVAALEERAAAMANDPDAQVLAGNGFLQQIYTTADGPQKGMLASRADQYFDRALELEPTHWEARFTKAVSLSFWPPVFGKQAEAIRHFEILAEQQSRQALADHHAQTYELLGNLYQQSGAHDKAKAIWTTGHELFPQNASFAEKLGQESAD